MFRIGDKVVHPMHGAGVIDSIAREKSGGGVREYYVFRTHAGGLVLKIPLASSELVGLRPAIGAEEARRLLEAIPKLELAMTSNWNLRYRENMARLKSGDLYQVAGVMKGLTDLDRRRGLSNGERKMLRAAKQILISELAMATGGDFRELERDIDCSMAEVCAG